jgi:hypothetical protein
VPRPSPAHDEFTLSIIPVICLRTRATRISLVFALISGWLRAENPAADPPGFLFIKPLPAVVNFAAAHGIPIERIETPDASFDARPGDSVTALVTFADSEAKLTKQWIIQLTTMKLTSAERQAKPADIPTMYSSTGTELRFEGMYSALDLRTIGPFQPDLPDSPGKAFTPSEKHARKLVNSGFLGLGFDQGCHAILKLNQAAREGQGGKKLDWRVSDKPFPAEQIATARPLAEAIGFTPDDERSFVGCVPALFEFFNVAQKTPGLQEILSELLNKTSLAWSLLTNGGKLQLSLDLDPSGIRTIDPARWGANLPPTCQLPFVISLNKKPVLKCELFGTAPYPPLLAGAGVIGLIVVPADKKTQLLQIRVLAARRAIPPRPTEK